MTRPRIGFLGLGWIGRHRMQAIAESGHAEIVALADPSPEAVETAAELAPDAARGATMEDVLAARPDGVVIATPSALHVPQVLQALEAGAAVFCQKPLGRNAAEAAQAVEAARRADLLLAADLSYRHTAAFGALMAQVEEGALGDVFAADFTFHNAYGPDKPWFYDKAQSGGGCLIDLGVHLVDQALWLLGADDLTCTSASLFSGGGPVGPDGVEDYCVASLRAPSGTAIRIACSWTLPAGREAVIEAQLYGTKAGAEVRNEAGSFYNFSASRFEGTAARPLVSPPDDWGGRAAVDWARRLAEGEGFDPDTERLTVLARVIDGIYAAAH